MKFPILMSYIACGDDLLPVEERLIILFLDKTTGVVVQPDGFCREIGEWSNRWVNCDDSGHWEMVRPDHKIELDNNILLGAFYREKMAK